MTNPKLDEDDQAALNEAFAALATSPAWTEMLKSRNWSDAYLPADEFGAFLAEENARISDALHQAGVLQ